MKFNVAFAVLAFAAIVRADYGAPTTTPYCDELTTTATPTGTVQGGESTPAGGYATSTPVVEGSVSTPAGGYATSTPVVEGGASTPCDSTPTGTVEGGESTPAGGYETSTPVVEGEVSTPCEGSTPTTPGVEGEGPTPTGTPAGEDDDCDEWETETPTPEATDINSYSAALSTAEGSSTPVGFIVGIVGAGLAAVGAVAGTLFYVNRARQQKASMA